MVDISINDWYLMVKIIEHKNIDQETINEIIEIKQLSWDYPFNEHLHWIQTNLKDNDLHVLLINNYEIVAYMNLVNVYIHNYGSAVHFLGVGNVCSKYKGFGFGKQLISQVNAFLEAKSFYGILFCKKELVEFYKKYYWIEIANMHPNDYIYTLVYNYKQDTSGFVFNDRIF